MSESENTLDAIAGLAKGEMVKRLKESPDSIPSHVLGRLAMDAHRAIERQEREEEREPEPESYNLLLEEALKLPPIRGLEIVNEELRHQRATLRRFERAKAKLEQAAQEAIAEMVQHGWAKDEDGHWLNPAQRKRGHAQVPSAQSV